MKRITAIILSALLLLSFCACGDTKLDNEISNSATPSFDSDNTTALSESKSETGENLGERVYDSVDKFDYWEVDGGVTIVEFKNNEAAEYDKIIIPSEIDGKKVVGIGDDEYAIPAITAVYGNCEIVIPDTVKYIAKRAFIGAEGLVKLSGGENCVEISEEAFLNCTNLAKVDFIDHVEKIGTDAFNGTPLFEEIKG